MKNTKYTWVKGFIFQRKSDTTPFAIKTMKAKNENFTEFTVKFSKKSETGGEFDTTYYNCVAFGELGATIPNVLNERDAVLCKTVKKEREYNGKTYINYTVYAIYKEIKAKTTEWNKETAIKQAEIAFEQAITAQNEFNFDDVANETEATGKEVEIPF